MKTELAEALIRAGKLLTENGYLGEAPTKYEFYQGRGARDTTLGVVIQGLGDLNLLLVMLGTDPDVEEFNLLDEVDKLKTDNLGYDKIVY